MEPHQVKVNAEHEIQSMKLTPLLTKNSNFRQVSSCLFEGEGMTVF